MREPLLMKLTVELPGDQLIKDEIDTSLAQMEQGMEELQNQWNHFTAKHTMSDRRPMSFKQSPTCSMIGSRPQSRNRLAWMVLTSLSL
jgi:hypothetical protein